MKTSMIVLIFLTLFSTLAFAQPKVPDHWQDGYVLANGIRIHYWRTGIDSNKPVMVLFHGYSDDGLCWAEFVKELESDYDIIMVDARGHGLSDPPSQDDPLDAQAEDIAGFLKALKLTKPILMGHSMGSYSVAWFAAKHPDIPRAVILEDPRLVPRTRQRDMSDEALERSRQHILSRNNTPYKTLLEQCLKRDPQWGRAECEWWAPSKRLYHPNNAYLRWSDLPSMTELFPKIKAPTLILKADAEGELRQKNKAVEKLLKNGQLVHVKGAGHCVRRDQKDKVLAILNTFFNKNL